MNVNEIDSLINAFRAARVALRIKHPFFASLLEHVPVYATYSVPTAAISSNDKLYINPMYFLEECDTLGKRLFLLCHEVMHPALGYFFRSADMEDKKLANIAHDHIINLAISEIQGLEFIEGGYRDPRFAGMSFEEIYEHLLNQEDAKPENFFRDAVQSVSGESTPLDGTGGGNEGNDDGDSGPNNEKKLSPSDLKRRADVWAARVIKAAEVARAFGHLPAGISRLIDNLTECKIPWEEHLKLIVNDLCNNAYHDYSHPGRRYSSTGIYSPSEKIFGFNAVIYQDTSGSISKDQLNRSMAEVKSILELAGGRLRILGGDTEVTTDVYVDEVPDSLGGGGGTSFVPVFEYLSEEPQAVDLLVIFTDTWGTMPDWTPEFPVIWCVYEECKGSGVSVPFGEIVWIPKE